MSTATAIDIEQYAINIAKGLIMDTVRNANSGHTGGPLSSLDFTYTLFTMGTIWALNIAHAAIVDLDRNVSDLPKVDIVYNELAQQPQLRLSIALD